MPTISNPVFSPLIESVQATLELHGYGLMIHCSDRDSVKELDQCKILIERGVDGILLGNPHHEANLFEMLEAFDVPFLCVAGSVHGVERPAVTYDAGSAMMLALEHVLAFGHRDIAIFSGPSATTPVIADRLSLALTTLAMRGLTVPASWCLECGNSASEAGKGAAALLGSAAIPTAILCTGDLHALAVLAACHERGLQVPRDISVMGCNDLEIARFSAPSLSSVHTPYSEMGAHAAEMMISMITGMAIPELTLLPSRLVERGSVAEPRNSTPTGKPDLTQL